MGSKKDKNALEKKFQIVKVDLLLTTLLKESNIVVFSETSKVIGACRVLEELDLVDSSKIIGESDDGDVGTHYIFMATNKLKDLMIELELLDIPDGDIETL